MLIDAFGWSWEYIDEEMTMPRMMAVLKRWEVVPPLSISIAGIASALGIVKREPSRLEDKEQDFSELIGVLGVSKGKPEWLTKTE